MPYKATTSFYYLYKAEQSVWPEGEIRDIEPHKVIDFVKRGFLVEAEIPAAPVVTPQPSLVDTLTVRARKRVPKEALTAPEAKAKK